MVSVARCRGSVNTWCGARVEIGFLLESVRYIEQACLVKIVADDLQTYRLVVHQSAGHGQGLKARQVGGDGVNIFQVHGNRILAFSTYSYGGRGIVGSYYNIQLINGDYK